MARNFEIEALNLEIRLPFKEEPCAHRFGLLSEPDLTLKTNGDAVNLRKKESALIVSNLLANLIDSISSSMVGVSKESWKVPTTIINTYNQIIDNPVMQSCDDISFQEVKIGIGKERSRDILACDSSDRLVPEHGLKWEDDQESINDKWNEMSTSQNNDMKCQNSLEITNATPHVPHNDDGTRHSQNESDEFNFSLSNPSSLEEFEESNDMFSQIFKKNLQSKKNKVVHFGKAKPLPSTQTLPRIGPSPQPMARPFKCRVVSYSQNDKRNAFQRFSEIEFCGTPTEKQDKDEKDISYIGFTTPITRSQLTFPNVQEDEPDLFENTGDVTYTESPVKKMGVDWEEIDAGNFSTQSSKTNVTFSQNGKQDAIDTLTGNAYSKSSEEMSEIFDEEIDAAIENYVHTQTEVLELASTSSYESSDHLQLQGLANLINEKIDVSTQTTISGSIYSSIRCNRIEKSSSLKRSLQALCLENLVFKKPKADFSSSSISFVDEQSVEIINGFEDSPKNEENREVPDNFREFKLQSESKTLLDARNVENFWAKEKQYDFKNDELEQDGIKVRTEPLDQEVPRNIVLGTLPILPPGNFCWKNDPQASVENDVDDSVNDDVSTKPKHPLRLRLGLSKRAKPLVSLHQFL